MALGKNLKLLRKHRRMTQTELSEAITRLLGQTVSQSAISFLEHRDSKSSEYVPQIASALRVSADLLFDEKKAKAFIAGADDPECTLAARSGMYLPVFSMSPKDWRQIRMADSIDTQSTPEGLARYSDFWVVLDDDSCLPHYPPKTRFLIIQRDPSPGDLVFASLPDDTCGIRIFRRPTKQGYKLDAINSDNWADYEIEDAERDQIIGVVALCSCTPIKF